MSTQMNIKNEEIELFPTPRSAQSTDLPTPKPLVGVTATSTAALQEVLQDNHKRWHCYFTDSGFHNHNSHTAIALWYLGADADIIKASDDFQGSYQRPAFSSPGPINKDNWTQHLGDDKYYDSYLAFFISELAARGPADVLEEYIFSRAANIPRGDHKVAMLTHFHEILLHPFIHTGCGFELGLPGLIAEGLGQAAIHLLVASPLVPAHWFEDTTKAPKDNATPSVLDILSRIAVDSDIIFDDPCRDLMGIYMTTVHKYSAKISRHVETWSPDLSTGEGLRKTLEEVIFFASIIYAVPGLVGEEEGDFNADFFTMHLVTSAMFLPTLLIHLKPKSQELLLRTYVAFCLVWYIARGKPQLDVEAFFTDTSSLKSLLDGPIVSRPCLPNVPAASRKCSNPWTSIIEETIVHPDDHVPKLQRSLLHFAQTYGQREAGYFKSTELKGAELIDGTLFVRAANLTARRVHHGHAKETFEGPVTSWWDRRGHYSKA